MTSLSYDDSIEIISSDADCHSSSSAYVVAGVGPSRPTSASLSASATAAIGADCGFSGRATATAYVSFSAYPKYCDGTQLERSSGSTADATVRRGRRNGSRIPPEMQTPQYRRMRCAIIVMAFVMILASVLLVGVSLSMAGHIDDLGEFTPTS